MAKRERKPSKEDGTTKGKFINPKDFKVGDWLMSKDWGEFQVIDYPEARYITIRFPKTGNTMVRMKDSILRGAVIDRVYVNKKVKEYKEKEQKKRDSFDVFMETWNPISHHKDVFKLPYFYKCGERGWVYKGFTYVDKYTYDSLKGCRLTRSVYVQLTFSKFNCARLGVNYGGRGIKIPLHCWVKAMPTGQRNIMTDHANGLKLDNRPSNLRVADGSQNTANSKAANYTGYKGVSVVKPSTKGKIIKNVVAYGWVSHQSWHKCLGNFYTIEEAAKAVDIHNIAHYGEFARLNLKRSIYEEMGLLEPKPRKYNLPK